MAITKDTKIANRFGLKTSLYAASDATMTTALLTLDFVNISEVDIKSDRKYATGGQAHVNTIVFDDPITGTFKLSTQTLTTELVALMAGNDVSTLTGNTVVFQHTPNTTPKYYIIKSETVWMDDAGTTYAETLTFHKVCPQKAFKNSYSGEGDPQSVDIIFDVLQDADGKALTIERADVATGG